jgi:hypothetical protein
MSHYSIVRSAAVSHRCQLALGKSLPDSSLGSVTALLVHDLDLTAAAGSLPVALKTCRCLFHAVYKRSLSMLCSLAPCRVLTAVILLTEGVVVYHCCCSYYASQQREILGTLTVEELYKDRAAFSERVREHVFADISAIGFVLVSSYQYCYCYHYSFCADYSASWLMRMHAVCTFVLVCCSTSVTTWYYCYSQL